MTVGELIEELKKVDPARLVVLQRDEEGNSYQGADGVDDNAAFSAKAGEVGLLTIPPNSKYTEEDLAPRSAIPCVVIFP